MSRARHELTGTPLAPKTEATLQDLQSRQEVINFVPESPLQFDVKLFVRQCPRSGGLHE